MSIEEKLIKYVLRNFGLKGGRFLILDKSIDELVELAGLTTDSIPTNFYDSVRDKWASLIEHT